MAKRKRKVVGAANEPKIVVRRECDESMARSKGFLPCDHNCKTCFACIEILDTGERQHFSLSKAVLSGRKKVEE